ncbi:uncharacterized protein IL334_001758 [Kwoniella shivajii]|uniref:Uncharacterized protein n=1 Tax=Kwoniella shivajii TaxID=564305 RepID=A0ABZ1CST2_9TREE|nr:hypothetical protein IL334_001758 [Kwoniella shivajii]
MSVIDKVVQTLSDQISSLSPDTFSPTTPIFQVSKFVHHLTTTPIHPVYFPYLRFHVIHAIRVTTVWAILTKGKKKGGRLQDLFGYLVMAWGGSTVISMLLNRPPTWLISSTPWIIYPSIYTLLIPTGLSSYFVNTCPTIMFNVIGAFVDGMTRGSTITSLSSLLTTHSIGHTESGTNIWAYTLLSALAVSSGGLLVGLLGLNENDWKLSTPNLLKGGFLTTLDAWSASLIGILWLTLTRQNTSLNPLSNMFEAVLPHELKITSSTQGKFIDTTHAGSICVLILGSLLATRAIILSWKTTNDKSKQIKVDKKSELFIIDEKQNNKNRKEKVIKTPVKVNKESISNSSKLTPRKSPRAKSK